MAREDNGPIYKAHFKDSKGNSLLPYLLKLDSTLSNDVAVEVMTKLKNYFERKKGWKTIASEITSTQMRNIYNIVKDVGTPTQLHLKRPKLAYISARQVSTQQSNKPELIEFIDEVIQSVTENGQIDSFKTFMEAVVAYHKYFNPK